MTRITFVGCIFVAVLFLVCVEFFISRKPAIPNPTVQPVPSIASPDSTPKSEPVAPAPLSPV